MHLHIVSFNVPWPADYGGVIDVFYRIRALSQAGVRIHLHCYTYGRTPAPELAVYCEEVIYYERDTSFGNLLKRRPYIVASRCSKDLLDRLHQDNYPILLEGLHNCWVLEQLADQNPSRQILVRAHNVEHDYYSRLAKAATNLLRRIYLRSDACKLKRYEKVLLKANAVLAISNADAEHFKSIGCCNVVLIPASCRYDQVITHMGIGAYALYHGDLSVPENIQAARFFVKQVFSCLPYNLILAGRNPSPEVQRLAAEYDNVHLESNPDDRRMEQIIGEAQINVLFTQQPTGMKLKLLNSLYCGRHCLVNSNMVTGTGLATLCMVADGVSDTQKKIQYLMTKEITQEDINLRRRELERLYSNAGNAQKLINLFC